MTMKPQHPTPPLQELLDAYAVAGPSLDRLKTWTQAYPRHRSELTTLTVAWLLSAWEDERATNRDPSGSRADVEHALLAFGRSLTPAADAPPPSGDADLFAAQERQAGEANSLRELVLSGGEDLDTVLAHAHLSFDLFSMLNTGLVTFVEAAVRERVAVVLAAASGIALGRVAQQLQATRTRLGAGASLSHEKPSASTLDFFEAIEEDDELPEADKAFWRAVRTETLIP